MTPEPSRSAPTVVLGAGPAGLTAAYLLSKSGAPVCVLEADEVVGGLSRTVERDGWRFDIGGHRFFTKVPEVEKLWQEILPDDDFLVRPRLSRIYYEDKLFDYPLRPTNALRNLGVIEALRCLLSYVWVRLHPPKDQSTLEGWVAARFGWRLYRIFFKTYNEKVWGVPASQIEADWAAQRIKNLSLASAVINAIFPKRGQTEITTLIDEFRYPKYGPGMMWERARDLAVAAGARLEMSARVVSVKRDDTGATAVVSEQKGKLTTTDASAVISSIPLPELALSFDPPPPAAVQAAAHRLRHRDFLTVAVVVPQSAGFRDNWIYIHSPDVRVGRVQNFGSWSPYLVKQGRTCLGLEYFVTEGDELWAMSDEDLAVFAARELGELGLVESHDIEAAYVVRIPKAYPVYDEGYAEAVESIRAWVATAVPNVFPIGRNGMHKYNNQDHSMLTAMLVVENLLHGTQHDVWSVNVDEDYHEATPHSPTRSHGSGRDAPILPRRTG